MSIIQIEVPVSEEASIEDSRAEMEKVIQDRLGISRVEFLKKLDAGAYDDAEDTDLLRLVTLAPFAR